MKLRGISWRGSHACNPARALITELSLQDDQLVAQGEDLNGLLSVGHRQ
ncbi:hypothetical protein A4R44_09297 [Amycolatopsis sp. M39]|nr:hypothetical protein A4R44_09297 [Amycolatopsis sp. M39]